MQQVQIKHGSYHAYIEFTRDDGSFADYRTNELRDLERVARVGRGENFETTAKYNEDWGTTPVLTIRKRGER